jgi:hypothetical protein
MGGRRSHVWPGLAPAATAGLWITKPTSGSAPTLETQSTMHETERLSALIGDIYDAALDPTLWV